jgi:hypothetical protein
MDDAFHAFHASPSPAICRVANFELNNAREWWAAREVTLSHLPNWGISNHNAHKTTKNYSKRQKKETVILKVKTANSSSSRSADAQTAEHKKFSQSGSSVAEAGWLWAKAAEHFYGK